LSYKAVTYRSYMCTITVTISSRVVAFDLYKYTGDQHLYKLHIYTCSELVFDTV